MATRKVTRATRAGVFVTTHWTEVLNASGGSSPQAAAALETLCQKYWYPLYAFIRREGHNSHDAQDLTQAFFAKFLEKNFLAEVHPSRGKFRSFLLAALKHFLANEWDRAKAKKRGGEFTVISWDEQNAEARYSQEPAAELNAEKIYDRRWALTILDQALARLQKESEAGGKADQFEALKPLLMLSGEGASHAEIAQKLNMNLGALKVAAHRLRKRFRALLREEIAQTVSQPEEVEDELRYLVSVLST